MSLGTGAATDAGQALERLREGNRRFAADARTAIGFPSPAQRAELTEPQRPFAVVLGCSDSRVPAEIVFDQGIGDLFVIRVAGNITAPSQVGSVEFAVEQLGTRLVVVLGHSRCGAVLATLDELRRPTANPSEGLRAIVDHVRPAFTGLLDSGSALDPDALVQHAVRANIHRSAHVLRTGSPVLRRFIEDDGLVVVGAEYSLDSGVVEFLDPQPSPSSV